MASLTPLSKGLIGLAVVGAVASAVWHLGLKERFADAALKPAASSSGVPAVRPATPTSPVAGSTTSPPAPTPAPAPTAPTAVPAQVASLSPAENAEMGRKLLEAGNHAQARVHLEHAVRGGDPKAACHLGEMTMRGQGGIPVDQEKAASLFRQAQAGGMICFTMGK